MNTVATLLNLACGRPALADDDSHAQRLQIVIGGLLAAVALASLWGLAAGCRVLPVAIGNLYKLPMIVLLSTLGAVPAGLLAWKLTGAEYRATDLLANFTSGVLSGTLVLVVLSPIVALYYHSSAWAGPMLALGSVFLALFVGSLIFVRGVGRRVGEGWKKWSVVLPVVVTIAMQLATLLQLIAIASPILPEVTVFDGGLDRVLGGAAQHFSR
ncbi:MAG: hypothetical protein JXR83_12860 [Deltaproteobacteria bacterium]|nr:hypothetical protein [Deltaproteobacteria bacterium]